MDNHEHKYYKNKRPQVFINTCGRDIWLTNENINEFEEYFVGADY